MTDKFVGGITQDFDYFRGEVGESPISVVFPYELARGLGDIAEALFAVPERLFRAPACRLAVEVIEGKRNVLSELVDEIDQFVVEKSRFGRLQMQGTRRGARDRQRISGNRMQTGR